MDVSQQQQHNVYVVVYVNQPGKMLFFMNDVMVIDHQMYSNVLSSNVLHSILLNT